MRVLVAHNAYQQRGGEDAVVESEVALLRHAGHEVELLLRHNDEIPTLGRAQVGLQTLWSRRTGEDFRSLIARHRPDVVHVHNSFPLLSPSLHWASAAAGIPLVQTLHNFRLLCPQAMFLREGRVCEDCLNRAPWPAVRHGCYRGSRAQTAVVAGMLVLHRGLGTWQHKVARYIALTEFSRRKFIEGGLPAERVRVKPNFVAAPVPAGEPRAGFLFVGRLSSEKGIRVLAEAWRRFDGASKLAVAGSGPEEALLRGLPGAALLGALPSAAVQSLMQRSLALVLPSIWYENFPRTIVEAMGAGLAVIASRIGALPELVIEGETGLLFEAANADDLARSLGWAQSHPQEMAQMGRRARAVYEARYTPERNLAQLLAIYTEAGAEAGLRGRAAAPRARR